VAKPHTVCDMQVQREQRVPLRDQLQHGVHLCRLTEYPVSIQVNALRGDTLALQAGTILIRAVIRAGAFMPIHVENGHK